MNHFNDDISIIPVINEVEDYPDYIPASKLDMKSQPSTSMVLLLLIKKKKKKKKKKTLLYIMIL